MDRRIAYRQPVDVFGTIVHDGDQNIFCQITDISQGGASLKTTASVKDIPAQFDLICKSLKLSKSCQVQWTNGNAMGVRFTTA